jgi:hypothetical protein
MNLKQLCDRLKPIQFRDVSLCASARMMVVNGDRVVTDDYIESRHIYGNYEIFIRTEETALIQIANTTTLKTLSLEIFKVVWHEEAIAIAKQLIRTNRKLLEG